MFATYGEHGNTPKKTQKHTFFTGTINTKLKYFAELKIYTYIIQYGR